jgi:cytochrome c oxidase assembly factor CtaG
MTQHLLLSMIVAPLVLMGLAGTAIARLAWLRLFTNPWAGWLIMVTVMWGVHLSGLYDAALDAEPIHVLEHGLFLGAGLCFWAPVVGFGTKTYDWHIRMGYLIAALPAQSFLGLLIYSADDLLYSHYPSLDDQRAGALVMWLGGDAVMLIALGVCGALWLRHLGLQERNADQA